ncbi:hypothetical protein MAPG_06479 [Magnaporthiopsis poae ATCC 64411]|uniref:Uncharacterized protein n=1 Tax=Magnaporthiopsis poae (strain ATCC 64411 / 73-15) TaxID=644358 RepID=A0A0C4E251_MAGP6|nr:hypothetical protein MAPG_06479 [Magnaporthiopsis poae ATCC 64411]
MSPSGQELWTGLDTLPKVGGVSTAPPPHQRVDGARSRNDVKHSCASWGRLDFAAPGRGAPAQFASSPRQKKKKTQSSHSDRPENKTQHAPCHCRRGARPSTCDKPRAAADMADGINPASTPANSTGSSGRDVPLPDKAANGGRRPAAHHHAPSATTSASAAAAPPQLHPLASPPPGHGLRRAATVAEPSLRRRAILSPVEHQGPADPGSRIRRRDSVISSDGSLDALDSTGRRLGGDVLAQPDRSPVTDLQSVPLLFALLPALGGLMFKDGSAFVTDFLLLGLAAVFLHSSLTAPWKWYHSAQQIRVVEEMIVEEVADEHDYADPSDENGSGGDDDGASSVDDGEESANKRATQSATKPQGARHTALRELYFHEITALLMCFLSPVVGASILHGIRTQLSRPSEGLVSNYNLTVFLLAAEIRPVRHLMCLVQARTIHLQRVVLANPYALVTLMLPFRGVWLLACLPVRLLATALGRDQRQPEKMSKGYRSGRSSRPSSNGGDRFPARLSRR